LHTGGRASDAVPNTLPRRPGSSTAGLVGIIAGRGAAGQATVRSATALNLLTHRSKAVALSMTSALAPLPRLTTKPWPSSRGHQPRAGERRLRGKGGDLTKGPAVGWMHR
jgi:hypothetical protein